MRSGDIPTCRGRWGGGEAEVAKGWIEAAVGVEDGDGLAAFAAEWEFGVR